jgi:2,3-dihydroxybenzoate decarboxylase
MAQTTVGVQGGGAKMKKICIEEHWHNPEVWEMGDQWRKRTRVPLSNDPKATPQVFPRIGDFEKFRLPLMDEYGITMQVLASNSPGIQAAEDATTAVGAAKRFNDAQAEIIRKYLGRFAGWASLPTQDPKAAADELERAVKQLGFKGAMIQGHTNWEYLDEKKFWVIWELMGPAWSWVVEAATHALRIVGGGVFDAFPKASLILGHLGETLPFLLGRLDEGYAMSFKPRKLNKKLSEYVKENIYVTTSGRYKPEALICTINAMGIDRVLFAADYPYAGMKEAVEDVERTPLGDSDKEKIYHLNAERLFRL